MNDGDHRLLLLAAVSQKEQILRTTLEEDGSSTILASKESSCSSNLKNLTAAESKTIAVGDGSKIDSRAVATLPPKMHRRVCEAIPTDKRSVDPNSFILNEDEDIMAQLHRNGLDQVRIPPLSIPQEKLSILSMIHKQKRQVSDGTHDISCSSASRYDTQSDAVMPSSKSCIQANNNNNRGLFLNKVTGGSSPQSSRKRPIKLSSAAYSVLPDPPFGGSMSRIHRGDPGRGSYVPKRAHDYHQQIMSMSMAGISDENLRLLIQRRLNNDVSSTLPCGGVGLLTGFGCEESSNLLQQLHDQGPLKKLKTETSSTGLPSQNKNPVLDSMMHRYTMSSSTQDPLKRKQEISNGPTAAVEDGLQFSKVEFPNQAIYSQMLREKMFSSKRKNPPEPVGTLAAQELRRDNEAQEARTSVSRGAGSLSVQKDMEGPTQLDLQIQMALMKKRQQQQLRQYHLRLLDGGNAPTSFPSKPITSHFSNQDPRRSNTDPNLQVQLSLLELENQISAEEQACVLQSNHERVSDLHQQALHLEEQMKLREMEFMRERSRLIDIQTVNKLRLQADELEKRLMK